MGTAGHSVTAKLNYSVLLQTSLRFFSEPKYSSLFFCKPIQNDFHYYQILNDKSLNNNQFFKTVTPQSTIDLVEGLL